MVVTFSAATNAVAFGGAADFSVDGQAIVDSVQSGPTQALITLEADVSSGDAWSYTGGYAPVLSPAAGIVS